MFYGESESLDVCRSARGVISCENRPVIETAFLDAGGVLVHPNFDRVAQALVDHGVPATGAALRAVGGAVYYAIYRRLPDLDNPNPYWSEMHPDDDKGEAGSDRQRFTQAPPSI